MSGCKVNHYILNIPNYLISAHPNRCSLIDLLNFTLCVIKGNVLVTESRSTHTPHRLLCPLHSLGKNTGEGSHSLLQGIFLTQESSLGLPHCRQILYHFIWAPREGQGGYKLYYNLKSLCAGCHKKPQTLTSSVFWDQVPLKS